MNTKTKNSLPGIVIAFFLWYIVFLTNFLGSFWIRVTTASMILACYAVIIGKENSLEKVYIGNIVKGLISGFLLYLLFYLGFYMLRPFVLEGALQVYKFKLDSMIFLPILLLVITSFCEEFFWRRYIQNIMRVEYGCFCGILFTTLLYGLIHFPTFNFPLICAAFISGLFWGYLYEYTGSLWVVIVSHIVWTELIFVFLPLV